jgi:hypothetical protein
MNVPSFSHMQEPNALAANARLHRDLAQERAENAELRNTVTVLRARIRSGARALTAGDPTAALAALTEETL